MKLYEIMGIKKDLLENIRVVLVKYNEIERAVLFGSRAIGNYKKSSDIDICLFENGMSDIRMSLAENDLHDINTVLTFDVLFMCKIQKKELKDKIIKEGVEIYVKQKSQ